MKILCVDGRDIGGVGGALRGQEMSKALASLGHEVVHKGPHQNLVAFLDSEKDLDGAIMTGTWHQLMYPKPFAVVAAEVADKRGIPVIWWYGSNGSIFGSVDPDAAKRAADERRVIQMLCERKFIGVICPYSIGIYKRHGVPEEKMRLVPSVFDGNLFTPAKTEWDRHSSARLREDFSIPQDAFVLGTVGNTPNSKGGDDVVRAFALLKDEMPDLHYLILHTPAKNLSKVKATSPDGKTIGNSEFDVLNMTKKLAVDLKVADRVHFVGIRFKREAMPMFYRVCNVYCSPSKAENLGQPLVESQLCGLPLVTYKGFSFDFVACPATAQQIEPSGTVTDDYGLIIPDADPKVLADAIRRARAKAEDWTSATITRAWTYQKFHWHGAQTMADAISEYKALM